MHQIYARGTGIASANLAIRSIFRDRPGCSPYKEFPVSFNFGAAIEIFWLAFVVYWLIAARGVNKIRSREPAAGIAFAI